MSHSKLNSAVQNQPREKYATLVLTELPFGAAAVAEARAAASKRVGHMKRGVTNRRKQRNPYIVKYSSFAALFGDEPRALCRQRFEP